MVFCWHFLLPEAKESVPVPPLSLFAEGHVGVSLFMTLSGYLFAKLLDGRRIHYPCFIWNRALRLLPLLIVVVAISGVINHKSGADLLPYLKGVATSFLGNGGLPNGGWSVIIELHFYLILPLLLWLDRKHKMILPLTVGGMIIIREIIRWQNGSVHLLAYESLVGRIDQFVLGIVAFHWRGRIVGKHLLAGCAFISLSGFYYLFDRAGGFYGIPSYPSPSLIWSIIPTIEAVSFGILIAWYADSFQFTPNRLLWLLGKAGAYSYSIYLLHFFFFHKMSRAAIKLGLPMENFYVGVSIAVVYFICMVAIGHVSYKLIEEPFLHFRKKYILE